MLLWRCGGTVQHPGQAWHRDWQRPQRWDRARWATHLASEDHGPLLFLVAGSSQSPTAALPPPTLHPSALFVSCNCDYDYAMHQIKQELSTPDSCTFFGLRSRLGLNPANFLQKFIVAVDQIQWINIILSVQSTEVTERPYQHALVVLHSCTCYGI